MARRRPLPVGEAPATGQVSGGLLYAVRHAQVAQRPEIPPESWTLSEEGRLSARRLAASVPWEAVTCIHHSPERKAAETAAIIGGVLGVPCRAAAGLRELRMDVGFLPAAAFESRVSAFLEGGPDAAFQDYGQARRRILDCVCEIVRRAGGGGSVIVSHGRILTVLFSAMCGQRLGGAEWRSIGLPDCALVDLDAGRVVRGFFAGRAVDARALVGPGGGVGGRVTPAARGGAAWEEEPPPCGGWRDAPAGVFGGRAP